MNKKILTKKGVVVAVILLFIGLAFVPSINANIRELSVDIPQENDALQLESEFQRIRAYIEMKSDEDCGCDDVNPTRWGFPALCTILFPLFILGLGLYVKWGDDFLLIIMVNIGKVLDCFWYRAIVP